MKRKDFMVETRGLSVDALKLQAREISEELMKLRFRKAAGQLEEAHRVGELRRNMARVQTLIQETAAQQGVENG